MTTAKSFAFMRRSIFVSSGRELSDSTAIRHQRRPMAIDPGAERKSAGYADGWFRSQGAIRNTLRR
jgi:hypothetical protein